MNFNPTFDQVQINDEYISCMETYNGRSWFYISTVLSMEPISKRFGKDDRVVYVKITTNDGDVVDEKKGIWVSQLLSRGEVK